LISLSLLRGHGLAFFLPLLLVTGQQGLADAGTKVEAENGSVAIMLLLQRFQGFEEPINGSGGVGTIGQATGRMERPVAEEIAVKEEPAVHWSITSIVFSKIRTRSGLILNRTALYSMLLRIFPSACRSEAAFQSQNISSRSSRFMSRTPFLKCSG